MSATACYLKMAIRAASDQLKEMGREVNVSDLESIVMTHACSAAISAAVAGSVTGVGALVATGVGLGFVVAMYIRLGAAMGITFSKGLIRAVASAILAELAAEVAVILAGAAAISFIPFVGNLSAGMLTAIANFCLVYLAAVIFMKMLAAMLGKGVDPSSASEAQLKANARTAMAGTDMKAACKEARNAYDTAQKNGDMKKPPVKPED